jgi:hypothetical protein
MVGNIVDDVKVLLERIYAANVELDEKLDAIVTLYEIASACTDFEMPECESFFDSQRYEFYRGYLNECIAALNAEQYYPAQALIKAKPIKK